METLDDYLVRLASLEPTPGGGSAATLVAAMGAALVAMVARICAQSPSTAQPARQLATQLIEQAERLRLELLAARVRDEVAFGAVVSAQALPRTDAEQQSARRAAIQSALIEAAREPLGAARLALHVLRLVVQALGLENRNLESDLGTAGEFARAALAACAYNVRINHRFLRNAAIVRSQEAALAGYEGDADALLERIRTALALRNADGP